MTQMKNKSPNLLAGRQASQKPIDAGPVNPEPLKIALLVDVENYKEPQTLFSQFLNGLDGYGKTVKKIAIGGWGRNKNLANWEPVCKAEKIEMLGYGAFNGKHAADKAIVDRATELIQSGTANAIAFYSRDTGFAIAFPSLKRIGATIIVPQMGNGFIPDADHYIPIIRDKEVPRNSPSDLAYKLMEALPQVFQNRTSSSI